MRADEILQEAAKTFRERNVVYGDNFANVGPALAALFPAGIDLRSADDWTRMHIFMLILVKLSRYAIAWDEKHHDSIRDACVYCSMLEMIDGDIDAKKVEVSSSVARLKVVNHDHTEIQPPCDTELKQWDV